MQMLRDARALASELGLAGTHVFFNEDWVDYSDRHNYLLEADLGVSAHLPGLETDFSFRTRMLDYLWAGLPMVATKGDFFADLIAEENLGAAVPMEDPDAMAQAFVQLLGNDGDLHATATRVDNAAVAFRWETTLAALVNYCANPWEAADRSLDRRAGGALGGGHSLGMLARKAVRAVRETGIKETAGRVRRYVSRRG